MKRQTPIQTQKETISPQMRGLLPHAAVRATPDHDMPSNGSAETRFGHDFSKVAVQPSAPVTGQDYSNASSPLFPQRFAFGGACHTCPPRIQAKLKVGQAGDKYEQEADRVAEQVMRMPEPKVQRKGCLSCNDIDELIQTKPIVGRITPLVQRQVEEEESAQRKPSQCEAYMRPNLVVEEPEGEKLVQRLSRASVTTQSRTASPNSTGNKFFAASMETGIHGLSGGGRPLPESSRAFFGPRFHMSFANVRVHTEQSASEMANRLNARAFTVGRDIVFARGEYAPSSSKGRQLLAHELTHVVQQTGPQAETSATFVQRFVSEDVAKVKDLVSYGFIDWVITDAEAVEALTILQGLPKVEQAEFVSDTKYLKRLRDNLPSERLHELESIEQSVAGSVPAKKTIDDIIDKLSYGIIDWVITDAEAVAVLEKLKTLSGEQLSVVLSRINYGRLMENLPDDRKQELIDLLARALGTGGIKETSEQASPGTALKSLKFTSDHGVMKDNTRDWENLGSIFPQPEWAIRPDGRVSSHPISHTKDRNVSVELGFDVLPETAASSSIKITGSSDVSYLSFDHTGTESGGKDKMAAMTSVGKLPNRVDFIKNRYIIWKMKWDHWEHAIGRSGPHTIFTTMNMPLNPTEVTYKRMALAVDLVSKTGTLVPHEIVRNIMFRWTRYNLDVTYHNAWQLADDLETGAQCIDLVRFVQGILSTVGSPGTAVAVVVWAQPTTPFTAIESPWPHSGMSSPTVPPHPHHPTWGAALLDGDCRPNNFEAALKFDHSGVVSYYPGGVRAVLSSSDEVLRVFNCLAWIKSVGGGMYEIMAVPASYLGGCVVGAQHRWGP